MHLGGILESDNFSNFISANALEELNKPVCDLDILFQVNQQLINTN